MKSIAEPVPVSQPAAMPQQRSKPLFPVRGVMSLVDRNEDEVLRLIKDGSLLWAFDVALDTKHGRSKDLRILPACVADFLRGKTCSLKWADVFSLLLPEASTVTSIDIYRVLNCSSSHLYNLVRRKQIIPCTTWGRGPKGKARFAAVRFIEFLQSRRFP